MPTIIDFKNKNWSLSFARLLQNNVMNFVKEKGECSVMLTGGRSAENLYKSWANYSGFKGLKNVTFYVGDERIVTTLHPKSNSAMIEKTLFSLGIPTNCKFRKVDCDCLDPIQIAVNYEKLLPKVVDVLLLSVGEDGHIASLFPHDDALKPSDRLFVPIRNKIEGFSRVSITPKYIRRATLVYVLAIGPSKSMSIKLAMMNPESIGEYPARLVLGSTWITNGLTD